VALIGDRRGAYRILVGRPDGKRLLGRPTLRCNDNIKMDLPKSGIERHELNGSASRYGQVAGTC
jgi:hypothetical protein